MHRLVGEHEVGLARTKERRQISELTREGVHDDRRALLQEVCQRGHQDGARHRRETRDTKHAHMRARGLGLRNQALKHLLFKAFANACVLKELQALARHAHVILLAHKERHGEQLFQLANALRHCRLRHADSLGAAGKARLGCDGCEGFEQTRFKQRHCASLAHEKAHSEERAFAGQIEAVFTGRCRARRTQS